MKCFLNDILSPGIEVDELGSKQEGHHPTETTQHHLDGADVVKVLQGLKHEHREIIDMAYYQGFTQQEIAERTSIPLGTVKSRINRGRIDLAKILRRMKVVETL